MEQLIIMLYWILFASVSFFLAYQIILFISAKYLSLKRKEEKGRELQKFLILIPAYKENQILLKTIEAIKKINYPTNFFRAIILADECEEKILNQIEKDFEIIRLNLDRHSKIESLKQAIPIVDNFDFVVVLDADNLIHPEFLNEINKSIDAETFVVQGLRLPKKLKTLDEKLDALTDMIYNQLDRIIPSKLGLTGTLSGSGFAIRSNLFANAIQEINSFGGFDKILQSNLMLKNIPIKINSNAIVYDEKIQNSQSYIKQRRRWLYYHFLNALKFGIKLVLSGILRFNFNQIHFGIVSLRPPLTFLYFISIMIIFIGFMINVLTSVILLFLLVAFSLIIILILKKENILSLKLMVNLPKIFINQIRALFKIGEARSNSLKTNHLDEISIEKILERNSNSYD
ncbi:MAG: glycosyltransferase family 2 protein [Ignavibacteria bacterium]|nr:glycosyltransferase family 2 protein [Ignavibacteria bacterium]